MKTKVVFLALFLTFLHRIVLSQDISFSGNVYGFIGDKVLLFKKVTKNAGFEGPISGVKISIKNASIQNVVYTSITGEYTFVLPSTGEYLIEITHEGYSSVQILLKYEDAGLKKSFAVTSFILKKENNSINDMGELLINEGGKLTLNNKVDNQKKQSADVLLSNKMLIEKCIMINNTSKQDVGKPIVLPVINKKIKRIQSDNKDVATKETLKNDSIAKKLGKGLQSTLELIINDSLTSVENLKNQLNTFKEELLFVNPNSESYQLLATQISNAENQLKVKERLIETQNKELTSFKKMIIYLVLFGIAAIIASVLLFVFLVQKKKHAVILNEKNKEITKTNNRLLSSIRYASVIQSGFFKEKNDLQLLFKNAFIYNQPKDLLSGDFYWFGHNNGHKIVAVADCTGHGVPGALLTMLGHAILEEIIVIQGHVLPSKILEELNKALVAAFSNQNELEFGIDITVISIKDGADELLFSGITNDLYTYSNKQLTRHALKTQSINTINNPQKPLDEFIKLKKGDCVYLLSDGYCDQFGKQKDKIEKYNLTRMENLLKSISEEHTFLNSTNKLNSEFNNWKGDREQTDDILVLGLKI